MKEQALNLIDLGRHEVGDWLATSMWRAEHESAARAAPRVLLIDDDPLFCRRASRIADRAGISLTTCLTVGEVLSLARSGPFDVAVLDYWMGDLTALQIAHLLGERTPVVLVSSLSRGEVHYKEWPVDVREFLPKSAGLERILHTALSVAGSKFCVVPPRATAPSSRRDRSATLGIAASIVAAAALSAAAWLALREARSGIYPALEPLRWDAVTTVSGRLAGALASGEPKGARES